MIARATISLLLTSAAVLGLAAAEPPKKPAMPVRTEKLFVGNGTLPSLPKSTMLPTAEDIESQGKRLSSRVRNMDPFGLATFPREEDQNAAPLTQIERTAERVTLNQALQTLNVTGINLDKKEILFRGRNVFEGDVMVLSFKNEVFLAQVLEVNATQILFRDVKRNEGGILPHNLLPHLELEPIQKRTGGLEEMLIPMETSKPLTQ